MSKKKKKKDNGRTWYFQVCCEAFGKGKYAVFYLLSKSLGPRLELLPVKCSYIRWVKAYLSHCIHFTLAAVTNNHDFGGLKQKQLMLSQSGVWNQCHCGLKSRYGRAMLSLEALFLTSSSFWWLWESLGLWPHLSNLCFHGHIAFSSSLCLSDVYLPFSYIDACMLSHFSRVLFFSTPCTIARQAPQSMGFLRQEYWSELPCPPPGDLPNPGVKPESLMSPALAGEFLTTSTTWEVLLYRCCCCSVAQLYPTLCHPTDCSTPGFHVLHHLPEFVQTHVHWVGDAIQPSHLLSSPSPPAFNLSQNQGLFQWVSSLHQMAKVLELQLQYQSFQWIFRVYKYLKYPEYEYLI